MRFLSLLLFVFPLLGACAEQGDLTPKLWSLPVGGYGVSTLEDDLLVGYLSVTTEQIAAVDVAERKVLWRSEEAELATFSPNAIVSDQTTYVFLAGTSLPGQKMFRPGCDKIEV